jgi:hypothetical protein
MQTEQNQGENRSRHVRTTRRKEIHEQTDLCMGRPIQGKERNADLTGRLYSVQTYTYNADKPKQGQDIDADSERDYTVCIMFKQI